MRRPPARRSLAVMRVARLYRAGDIRLEEVPVPEPGPGEALVRTRVCGICTGDIMGWYLERKAPLVFGHEPSGQIVRLGEGASSFQVGDRVFVHHHAPCGSCRRCQRGDHVHCKVWRTSGLRPGGMAEYFVVPANNLAADTLKLPDGVDDEAGSLIEPAACVVKSLRRGEVRAGDWVVVIGLGVMGQMHVALAAARGARVIAADKVPFRLERASELGALATVNVDQRPLQDAVAELTAGELADVVIVGPGTPEAMTAGIDVAGSGGRVVLFTTTRPDQTLNVSPYRLYFDEVSLVPSYSCGPQDTRVALGLIQQGLLPPGKFITHRFTLEQIEQAMQKAADVHEALKTVVVFS